MKQRDDAFDGASESRIDEAIAVHKDQPGPLLQVLHAVQDRVGFISPAAVRRIADALNLSRAEVHGVVTFYHYFRQQPQAGCSVLLCQAEACQSMRADELAKHARQKLGVGFHETTPDGAFSLEPVYCLGNCACSPAAMINGELHGRLTPDRLDALLDRYAEGGQKVAK